MISLLDQLLLFSHTLLELLCFFWIINKIVELKALSLQLWYLIFTIFGKIAESSYEII